MEFQLTKEDILQLKTTLYQVKNIPDVNLYSLWKILSNYPQVLDRKFYDDISIMAYENKDLANCLDYSMKAMNIEKYNEKDYDRLRFNQHFSIEKEDIINRYSEYNIKNIAETSSCLILNRSKPQCDKKITLTMTSCKRLELFKKTVNSFLECCLDKNFIDEWIVVDDNSNKTDRKEMKKLYPFIKFIFKSENDKGHAKSMNILLDKIKTPFMFHLEDDWCFFFKDSYLTKCMNILEQNDKYGQCLLNRNYSEDASSHEIVGGTPLFSNKNIHYYIHEFYEGDKFNEFYKSNIGRKTCAYWPHYSLRVGLTRMSSLKDIGRYNESADHFEREYAYRYVQKEYLTTFLDTIFCIHIGRKTYERNDKSKLNAYDLNNECQFEKKEKSPKVEEKKSKTIKLEMTEDGKDIVTETGKLSLNNNENSKSNLSPLPLKDKQYKISCSVISLERRVDKLKNFVEKNNEQIQSLQYKVFRAIDGNTIKLSQKIYKLFETGDFNYRKGIMGCALSHLILWIQLANSQLDSLLIFEDDATVCHLFCEKLSFCIRQLPDQWDILFLGHHLYKDFRRQTDRSDNLVVCLEKWDVNRRISQSMGGTYGYLISKSGAIKLLREIYHKGVYNGIDWIMFKSDCDIFYSYPHIVYSEYPENETTATSDIQKNFECLNASIDECVNNDLSYFMDVMNTTTVVNMISENSIKMLGENHIRVKTSDSSQVIITDTLPQKDILLTCITFLMCKNSDVSQLSNILNRLPVAFYTIKNYYIVVVPHTKINQKVKEDITFSGFLNLIKPV